MKIVPNTSTLTAQLLTGEIDVIARIGGISLDQAIAFETRILKESLPFKIEYADSIVVERIHFNLTHPLLSDLEMRKALYHSLNREEIIRALFKGKSKVANQLFPTKDPWFYDDQTKIQKYEYSPKKARKILDDLGWIMDNTKGFRYKNGQKLSFTLMTTSGNSTREIFQTYLKQNWQEIGIEVNMKNEIPRSFFSNTVKKRKFDAMVMYASGNSPEESQFEQFHSSMIPSESNGWNGRNNFSWKNPIVDQVWEKLEMEFDFNKRKQLAESFSIQLAKDIPLIPLYYRTEVAVVPKSLKGYRILTFGGSESSEVENWETFVQMP